MGSASREALAAARAVLTTSTVDTADGADVLAATRVVDGSHQLRAILADPSIEGAAKAGLLDRIFGSLTAGARRVLADAVARRWSSQAELVDGLEELGYRAIALGAPATDPIEPQLFAFGQAVSANAELELAIASRLGTAESKTALVDRIVGGRANAGTLAILRHLVQRPGGRRPGEAIRYAAAIVADQTGLDIATVTSAVPLAAAQIERLREGLTRRYGRGLRVNQVVDPSVIGGVRVQIGDDVIDGSVASKLHDLRLQLAG